MSIVNRAGKNAVALVALASVLACIPVRVTAAQRSPLTIVWVIRLTLLALGPDHHVDLDSNGGVRIFEVAGDKERTIKSWRLDEPALREFDAITRKAAEGPMPYKRTVPGAFVPVVSDCRSALQIDFYLDGALDKTTGDLVCQGGVDEDPTYVKHLNALLSKYILAKDQLKPAAW